MSICAVIPAAGKGTRLAAAVPKILVELAPGITLWDVIQAKLSRFVDRIHVVMSPSGIELLEQHLSIRLPSVPVSLGMQSSPRGMGDAVFSNYPAWRDASDLLVMWGDQVHVSEATLDAAIRAHRSRGIDRRCTIPVVTMPNPYVDYIFESDGRLERVAQSREGDTCRAEGQGDVGTFLLSTNDLQHEWEAFLESGLVGRFTGEINFLPFLPWLSRRGWRVHSVNVPDVTEARGINTREDLLFFQRKYLAVQSNGLAID
jgi:bifunctional UDP-N-acetylglucosamine pyrophosphorylase/glucosamine-1-phosphate N-acetyltransferase